jgi:hypothetical protein
MTVNTASGPVDVTVDQRDEDAGGQWNNLGEWNLGPDAYIQMHVEGGDSHNADAVKFEKVSVVPPEKRLLVTWEAPTTNADGTPCDDLAGYKVYHLIEPATEYQLMAVLGVGELAWASGEVNAGTHWICVTAHDSSGNESECAEGSKEVI